MALGNNPNTSSNIMSSHSNDQVLLCFVFPIPLQASSSSSAPTPSSTLVARSFSSDVDRSDLVIHVFKVPASGAFLSIEEEKKKRIAFVEELRNSAHQPYMRVEAVEEDDNGMMMDVSMDGLPCAHCHKMEALCDCIPMMSSQAVTFARNMITPTACGVCDQLHPREQLAARLQLQHYSDDQFAVFPISYPIYYSLPFSAGTIPNCHEMHDVCRPCYAAVQQLARELGQSFAVDPTEVRQLLPANMPRSLLSIIFGYCLVKDLPSGKRKSKTDEQSSKRLRLHGPPDKDGDLDMPPALV
jgi:hypothetical protein